MRNAQPWVMCAVLAFVASACALPTLEEAGKTACRSAADCLEGAPCIAGTCNDQMTKDGEGEEQRPLLCPERPCTPPSTCFFGLCAEDITTSSTCEENVFGDDKCPSDALCIEFAEEQPVCKKPPSCDNDLACPLSTVGSICLAGDIPGKEKFCYWGGCRDAEDCPTNWKCIFAFDSNPFGSCSSGDLGAACRADSDCSSNNCHSVFRFCL